LLEWERVLARCDGCGACESRCPNDIPRRLFNVLATSGWFEEALSVASDCTVCGLCERLCPHNIPYTEVIIDLRREEPTPEAVRRVRRTGTPYGRKLADESEPLQGDGVAILGCTIRSRPEWLRRVIEIVRRAGLATLGENEPCCMNFARKRGEEVPEETVQRWCSLFNDFDTVVVFCPGCYDFCVEVLDERPLYYAEIAEFDGIPEGAAYKSPCHLVRHGVDDHVLERLPDVELPPRRHRCCGGGALVRGPSESTVRAYERLGKPVLTPCPMCVTTLEGVIDVRPLWDHVVDLSR